MRQRQDSVTEQMRDLVKLGVEHGMYDAVDWITVRFGFARARPSVADSSQPNSGRSPSDPDSVAVRVKGKREQ